MTVRIILMISMMQIMLWGGAGDLDSSFGSNGIVTTAVEGYFENAQSVAIQSDGKIIAAGRSDNGTNYDFAVVRYNTDGSLDSTFDGDGIVTTDGGYGDIAYSVTFQSDGKIIVAGYISSVSGVDFAVVRYNTDGSLDSTFDGDGIVTTAVGSGIAGAYSVAIQSNGKIIVAGTSYNGSNDDFAVVRYNTDGSLDSTFDGDGIVTTAVGSGTDRAFGVAIQSDGKIIAAGWGSNDFAVVRYNTNGSLDSTFDGDGIVTTAIGYGGYAQSVAIQSDGKIIVAGWRNTGSNWDFALMRYHTNGSLDSTFDGDGIVTTVVGGYFDIAQSVAIQSNGKIIAAGKSNNGSNDDFAVVRYDTNGSLDNTFGSDGIVTTSVGSNDDEAYSAAIQNDGKIVVAGNSWNGSKYDFAVVRYLGDPVITLAPIYYLLLR